MSRPVFWFLLVFGLAGLLLVRESRQPVGSLAGVDRAFFDWLTANARPANPTTRTTRAPLPVTLVEIDDGVLERPGRWPLAPLEYAAFLHMIGKYDPAVVAVEPVVDTPPGASGTEQILLDEALVIPRLLLAVQLGSDAAGARDPASLSAVGEVSGARSALTQFPEIVAAPGARLQPLAAATGAANLPAAAAGPLRDVPLLFRCRDRVVPAFTLQALTLALRLAPAEVSATLGSHVQLGDRLRLPIDRAGRALLDARAFARVNRLGFDDLPLVAAQQATADMRAAAERMRGGIVVLGRDDRAARTLRMPGGRAISPAEVFAWAVASLELEPPTRPASAAWNAAIIAIFAAAGWATARLQRPAALALVGATLAVYLLAALSLFETSRLWLPAALPVGLTLLNALLPSLLPAPAVGSPESPVSARAAS